MFPNGAEQSSLGNGILVQNAQIAESRRTQKRRKAQKGQKAQKGAERANRLFGSDFG